jgi:hypothetical protein
MQRKFNQFTMADLRDGKIEVDDETLDFILGLNADGYDVMYDDTGKVFVKTCDYEVTDKEITICQK